MSTQEITGQPPVTNFQELILALQQYWGKHGCAILQPYDAEMGAGTFHPATFLRSLGPDPWRAAYVQPCRRPGDARYAENPNRLGHYYQFQVIIKPTPAEIQKLYLGSLEAIGLDLKQHDIRFVEDDWESPTLGAWGLGWEVWLDGMEVTQFTYFQQVGGVDLDPIPVELTYGLERLAMYLQKINNVYDLEWVRGISYGDVYRRNEIEWSHFNFSHADVPELFRQFEASEAEVSKLLRVNLTFPAYHATMRCSHLFNLLLARGAISVAERAQYIRRIRNLACACAKRWLDAGKPGEAPVEELPGDAIQGEAV